MPPRFPNPRTREGRKKTITPQYRPIQPVFLTVFTGVFTPLTLYSYPQPFGEQNKPPNSKNKEQEQKNKQKNKNNKQRTRTTNKEQEQQTKNKNKNTNKEQNKEQNITGADRSRLRQTQTNKQRK